jgi:hypothetical protein
MGKVLRRLYDFIYLEFRVYVKSSLKQLSEFEFLTGFEFMFVELGIATEVPNVTVKV